MQEIDQLYKIFQVMGTPDESTWPGVSSLPDYKPEFPKWRAVLLAAAVPTLDAAGVDLLRRCLVYSPQVGGVGWRAGWLCGAGPG